MSATSAYTGSHGPRKGLTLLSLDASGPRGVSQLQILVDIMERVSRDNGDNSKKPCEVFDAIGGVGMGGLIAIFLVVIKMTAKETLDEFDDIMVQVFKDRTSDSTKRTTKLKQVIKGILEKRGIDTDSTLIPTDGSAPTCRLIVPVMCKSHVGTPCLLRNYVAGHEPPTNPTIAEAMLVTCSTPPMFKPTAIAKDFGIVEYIGGDVGVANPIREIIAEAHRAFGGEITIACLLSIGCGHPGVHVAPHSTGVSAWVDFAERVAMDAEKMANEIGSQMSRLPLYYRFSVNFGLEKQQSETWVNPDVIATHTSNYLKEVEVFDLIDRCVDTMTHGVGFTTLEQLAYSGDATVLPPPFPPLTPTFVERKVPMDFVEKSLFDEDGYIKAGPKIIVVTGVGGCGKTQLIRKFVEEHENRFASVAFIDGSSKEAIQRDVVLHVRSLGTAHSQKSFGESMRYLSQPAPQGERLIVIDNVDDSTLDIGPFLPRWPTGAVIITSRNHSRGQMNPAGHLQLDVMSLDESVELLVRGSGWQWPPAESDRRVATVIAEELGRHPIALVQAISYMYNTGYSAETYIARLHNNQERRGALNIPATDQLDMRYKTAFAAFDASYDFLRPETRNVLRLLSNFHWQKFPLELVAMAAEDAFSADYHNYLPRGSEFERAKECLIEMFYSSGRWDPLKFDSIIATLRHHSLITVVPAGDVTLLQMHPLVHEWAHLLISPADLQRFDSAAIRLLCCGAKKGNYTMMQYLSSQVQACSSRRELHANDAASFGFILHESGMNGEAVKLMQSAHLTVKGRLGDEHLSTITASASLARTYLQLGRYADAEELEELVQRQRKRLLGPDHPDTIDASIALAATYYQLGRHADAERLQSAVLKQSGQLLGMNHPHTLTAAAFLAATYRILRHYAKAEELESEVLRKRKELLGVDHPDTIWASENLAATYHVMGRYAEAEELEVEVLRKRKQLLGLDHPRTLRASASLAVTYRQLRRYDDALRLETEVLKRSKELLGIGHPSTIWASANLAITYHHLGRLVQAEELEKEVLALRTTTLGERHPSTLRATLFLAQTYKKTQRYSEAFALAQSASHIALESFGDEHPLYQDISAFLASLNDQQPGRFADILTWLRTYIRLGWHWSLLVLILALCYEFSVKRFVML